MDQISKQRLRWMAEGGAAYFLILALASHIFAGLLDERRVILHPGGTAGGIALVFWIMATLAALISLWANIHAPRLSVLCLVVSFSGIFLIFTA